MDAYDIHQRIKSLWEVEARPVSGASATKTFAELPVYTLVDGKLHLVEEVYLDNQKIILRTDNGVQ